MDDQQPAISNQAWEELQRRVGSLVQPDTSFETDLAAIAAGVEQGLLDDLIAAETSDAWLDLSQDLLGQTTRAERFSTFVIIWTVHRQVVRTIAQVEDDESRRRVGLAFGIVATAFEKIDAFAAAAESHQIAATAFHLVGDIHNYANAVMNQAICLQELGQPGEARVGYDEAIPLLKEHGIPAHYARAVMNRAGCLQLGQPGEARVGYDEAVPLLKEHGTPAHYANAVMNRAICLQELGQPGEARVGYDEAIPLLKQHSTPVHYANAVMNRANCLRELGQPGEARVGYDEAVDACEALGASADETHWRARANLALLWRDSGNLALARLELDQAIRLVEGLAGRVSRFEDRLSLRGTYADVYRLAVRLGLAEAQPEAAFDRAQQAKGRLLGDLMEHEARVEPSDRPVTEPDTQGWREYRIDADGERSTPISAGLLSGSDRALLRGEARTLSDIQTCLHPREALLDLQEIGGSEGLVAFLVRQDQGLVFAEPLDVPALNKALAEFAREWPASRKAAEKRGFNREVPALAALRQALIAPLEASGALDDRIEQLFISPSGSLHGLPFAALWRAVDGQARYLCDDYLLSLVPTASSLWVLRQRDRPSGRPTLLGAAPFADDARLAQLLAAASGATTPRAAELDQQPRDLHDASDPKPLPHSGREIREVAAIVRAAGATAEVLVGGEATHQRVVDLAGKVYLFLAATHGALIASANSILDFLLLFAREKDGALGSLNLRAIYDGQMPLRDTFQVALTACHLGLVRRHGEDALGFTQAFLSAGAFSVLAPVWAVPDSATADLSIAYYRALLDERRRSVSTALREAMQTVRAQRGCAHPWFWAGFLPSGDGAMSLPR